SSDVVDADGPSVRRLSNNDLSEFFGRGKTPLCQHGIRELLTFRRGLAADFAGRVDRVLCLDRVDDFRNRDSELCQLIGLYPQSHRILAGAEYLHVADSRRPKYRVG